MEEVIVKINGVQIIETPDGWEQLTTTLKNDKEFKGFYTMMDVALTFYFDGYQLLKTAFDANGYCFSYPIDILRRDETGSYISIFTGTLFFKDIEFTEGVEAFSAKCQITDNNFFAKIANNKSIKAKIYVGKSKSGLDIPQADYWRVTFFNPTTGTYYPHLSGAGYERNDTGFRAYDVLRFLIDFMSDGTIVFESDFFSTGLGTGAMITCGKVPRFTSGAIGSGLTQELFEAAFPDLSFEDVFNELDKVYNLGFVAYYNGATPVFKLERYQDLYTETELLTLSNVEKLKRKTASDLLYAKLVTGSEGTTDETFLSFPETIRFLGFNAEEYAIVQDCNTDRELNTKNDWILSSNTIEDLLVNGATTAPLTYDSTIILIDTVLDVPNIWGDAVQTNWLDVPSPFFYNELFNNVNKANRYIGSIPNSIAAYLGTVDNSFSADSTAEDPVFPAYYTKSVADEKVIKCDNEISDPSGNYDPALFYYSAPTTGVYTFFGYSQFELFEYIGFVRADDVQIFIRRTDSGGAPILDTLIATVNIRVDANTSVIGSVTGSVAVNMDATDRAYLWIKIIGPDIKYRIYPNNKFQCTATVDGGGVYQEYDPSNYPVIRNSFSYPISFKEFRTLQAQPLGLIPFGVFGGKQYRAWIEEIKYKHFQSDSSFILISNETLN